MSETCAILKHILDWHYCVLFGGKMCHSETCYGLSLLMLAYWQEAFVFLLIAFEVALHLLLKTKQTNAVAWLYFPSPCTSSFFSCLRILHLTCSSKMKRFAECQSKVCFIMAHFSEWCAIPIWNNSGWHMYQNGTQHVHAKQLLDFIKVSVSLRCACNGIGKVLL